MSYTFHDWLWRSAVLIFLVRILPSYGACTCGEVSDNVLEMPCIEGGLINFHTSYNCSKNPLTVVKITISSTPDRSPVKLDRNTFTDFANLLTLSMSGIFPIALPNLLFEPLCTLESLDLSHNNISEIFSDLFIWQFDSLIFLNLSNNFLTALPNDFFSNFRRLASIDLSKNYLKTLPSKKPVLWPLRFTLLAETKNLLPCWYFNNTSLIKNTHWRCNDYSDIVIGNYQQKVHISCNSSGNNDIMWVSPNREFYQQKEDVLESRWEHYFPSHFHASLVAFREGSLSIFGMRPYFSGVWSCVRVWNDNNHTGITVINQLLLVCRSKIQSTYHWSLLVSGTCTAAMIIAGLLSALIRLLWSTRCFTRKVHVIATLSLHDLQYSPRFAEQRHKILRRMSEQQKLYHSSSLDPSITSIESVTPSWLPPHRQRSIDPFAHGGGPLTSDEDGDSFLDFPGPISSCDEDEEGDVMDQDDHRTRSRVDELRERFRRDVVKRVDSVKSRMREQRHNMEESTSKVMRTLKSGSSVAASKMRSGLYNSVESVKFQVKAVTDFCGGGSPSIGQTISVSTLDTDLDTQTTTERRIVDVTAV